MGVGPLTPPPRGKQGALPCFGVRGGGTLSSFGSDQLVNVPWNQLAFQIYQNSRQNAITVLR